MCTVESPLGPNALRLVRMSALEGVSQLFRYRLHLVSTNGTIPFDKMIGAKLKVTMALPEGGERYFGGIVARFSQGGAYAAGGGDERLPLMSYEAEVVPQLWRLTRNSDCRVFENEKVKDIITAVITDSDKYPDMQPPRWLGGGSQTLDYCVQYRETDFNFITRLLEESGLAYFFEQQKNHHTMVIFDGAPNREVGQEPEAVYVGTMGAALQGNEIGEWNFGQRLAPGTCALKDYNFEDPPSPLIGNSPVAPQLRMGRNAELELFDYPGNYKTESEGSQLAKLRIEAQEVAAHNVHGQGTCGFFVPGTYFKLIGRNRYANKVYLLTRVEHQLKQGVANDTDPSTYSHSFVCLPDDISYRPYPTAFKPTIHGSQTAVVVGPEGKEIHCDQYGRIRIQFHWDRYGQKDGDKVCWARVAQISAGNRWGAIFTPRVDQEVLVTFLEGDPDRPLVTGVVYNKKQMPPYELPANATQSGIKTRSSTGGQPSDFNEIRFEDEKDKEEIHIHAERKLSTVVEAGETRSVGADRSTTIGKDEKVEVKGLRETVIHNDENINVKNHRTVHIDNGHETIVIHTGNHTLDVNTGHHTTNVKTGNQELNVNAGHSTLNVRTGNRDVSVPAGAYQLQANQVKIEAMSDLTLQCGAGKININAAGIITIQGTMVKIN
jgi:type VI secretion system secreted protein VgrG